MARYHHPVYLGSLTHFVGRISNLRGTLCENGFLVGPGTLDEIGLLVDPDTLDGIGCLSDTDTLFLGLLGNDENRPSVWHITHFFDI